MLDDRTNQRRSRELDADLARGGVRRSPADGAAADASHREPGWAVSLSVADARALAVAWGQSAFFWYDGHRFSIEPALLPPAWRVVLPVSADDEDRA